MDQKKIMIISIAAIFVLSLFVTIFKSESNLTGYIVKGDPFEYYANNPSEVMAEYNSNIENVPGFVKMIFGDERINAEIKLNNGTVMNYGAITKKGMITSIEKRFIGNASLLVYSNESVLRDLIGSENQVDDLKKDLDTKAISYKAIKFKTKTKTFVGKTLLKIFSWLG